MSPPGAMEVINDRKRKAGQPPIQSNSTSVVVMKSGRGAVRKRKASKGKRGVGVYQRLTASPATNPRYPAPEVKFFDCDEQGINPPFSAMGYTPTPMTDFGLSYCLNMLSQGTGPTHFSGQEVSTKSVSYRVCLSLGSSPLPVNGRFIIVWDKEPNGVTNYWSDTFTADNYLSPMNLDFRQRFVILRNEQISLSPMGEATCLIEDYVPINMKTTYPDVGSTPSIPITGAIQLLFICNNPATANQMTIQGWFRTRFIDN